jgi:DNA polymerase-1
LDWKQQEYRVFASYAQEVDLIRQINEEDADFHSLIMQEFDHYFKGNRDMVKTFNFMLIYGGGVAKLAQQLGLTMAEARALKRDYFARFKFVDAFFRQVKETAIRRGYVFNKFGRRYYLPRDKYGNTQEYKLNNYLIQGSCADYVKMVMNKLEVYFSDKPQNVLLQVHDEFCIETPIGDYGWLHDVMAIMSDSMAIFGVKLGVDVEMTFRSWGEKVKWDLEKMAPKEDEVANTPTSYCFEEEGALDEGWAA